MAGGDAGKHVEMILTKEEVGSENNLLISDNFQVLGLNSQVLNVELQPGQAFTTEPGSILHVAPEIRASIRCDSSCARFISGESQCVTILTNIGEEPAILGITPSRPQKVVPIDLTELPAPRWLHCRRGSWLASLGNSKVSAEADCRFLTCCFGGQGIASQSISGEGVVFLTAGWMLEYCSDHNRVKMIIMP